MENVRRSPTRLRIPYATEEPKLVLVLLVVAAVHFQVCVVSALVALGIWAAPAHFAAV